MVRARRIGAKEKLAQAKEEIARLKAALADPNRVADELTADAPGDGIKILGHEAPKATGGMTKRQVEQQMFGSRWWCKVTELALPHARDVHTVATYTRNGENVQTFRARTEVLLPESEIQKLENECVVVSRMPVKIGAKYMTEADVVAFNPDMDLETDSTGRKWLVATQPRFAVQRLRPEQESLVIS